LREELHTWAVSAAQTTKQTTQQTSATPPNSQQRSTSVTEMVFDQTTPDKSDETILSPDGVINEDTPNLAKSKGDSKTVETITPRQVYETSSALLRKIGVVACCAERDLVSHFLHTSLSTCD
jgi:hypothetical protein